MMSSAIAFDQFGCTNRGVERARAPLAASLAPRQDPEIAALVQEIRAVEGEIVSNPPLLFKVVVAVGTLSTIAGGIGVATAALELLARVA